MSTTLIIVTMTIATLCLKSAGPLLVGGVQPSPPLERVITLFTPTLIAALVATSTFSDNGVLVINERALGVAAGLIAFYFRAPLLLAGVIAAATCAIARQLT